MTRKELIEHYYYAALKDVQNGTPIEDLIELIEDFKEVEVYEACAGIQRAIEDVSYWTMFGLIDKDTELLNKIDISYD